MWASVDAADGPADRIACAIRHARTHSVKYRIAVLGESAVDVVQHASGLLCDLGLSGWDATVLISGDHDSRGLDILGARTLNLECALSTADWGPRPHVVVVAGGVYQRHPRLQAAVLQDLEVCGTDLMLWDSPSVPELGQLSSTVAHRISGAARAFKNQALAALSAPADTTDRTEAFRSTAVVVCRDLLPMS